MLSVGSFVKRFHQEQILAVDSLVLPAGIYLIHGENGSGKTTLFKCLAGISPCDGDITVDGYALAKDPIAYRFRVNFAEAEPRYPPFLAGRDLLHFVGKTKHSDPQQMQYYVERLGIAQYYHQACGTYSSGMLKKLSLALSFLGDPRMMLLDEPLTTLDAAARQNLFSIIREKKHTLFLLSSHHAIESEQLPVTGTFTIINKSLVPAHN